MYVRPISTRLFRGMFTPAIRAIADLPLPLLVTRVLADHEHAAVPADDLALLTHRLHRRAYLHGPFRLDDPDGRLWRPVRAPLPSRGNGGGTPEPRGSWARPSRIAKDSVRFAAVSGRGFGGAGGPQAAARRGSIRSPITRRRSYTIARSTLLGRGSAEGAVRR